MKIAQVCRFYHPAIGGVETVVKRLSEGLVKKGHDVKVFCQDDNLESPKSEVINGVGICRYSTQALSLSASMKRSFKSNAGNWDIVHAHQYHALPAHYAAKYLRSRSKLVFTPYYHGTGHSILYKALLRGYRRFGKKAFSLTDKLVCLSKYE